MRVVVRTQIRLHLLNRLIDTVQDQTIPYRHRHARGLETKDERQVLDCWELQKDKEV